MRNNRLKVGIIGCGTIGSEIARACLGRMNEYFELSAVCDTDNRKASDLSKALGGAVKVMGMDALIKDVDLIVEAAGASISGVILENCIRSRRDCLIMSIGGILDRVALLKEADETGVKVYMPSGAVCGLDGLKSASVGRIDSVTLTTRKPPKGLERAPYLMKKGINITEIKEETVVFEGSANEAVSGFPQNINVAAVLSLAGLGADKTRVKIVSSPDYKVNTHEIEVVGEFGRLVTKTENFPSKTNPRTSALAVFSAIATMEGIARSVRIGT